MTEQLGWPVLHRQAVPEVDLLADIASGLPEAARGWSKLGRDYKRLEKQLTVTLNLGVLQASASMTAPARGDRDDTVGFRGLLHQVGAFAAEHHTGLLVTIDEASLARRGDLAALAGAVQTEINRGRLPVAVIFSRLPSFRVAIAVAGTFAERLPVVRLGDLERRDRHLGAGR